MLGVGVGIIQPVARAVVPSLDLTLLSGADPRISFTRASTATRFNRSGLLATVAADVARFDYNPATPSGITGQERVSNGDFTVDTSGWNALQGGVIDVDGGQLRLVSGAANYGGAQQTVTGLTAGKRYLITWKARKDNAAPAWLIVSGIVAGVTNNIVNTSASLQAYSLEVQPTGTSISLTCQCQNAIGSTAWFDDISVRELAFAPRGLLLEEARTNLLLWSRDFTNAAWEKTDVTPTLNQIGIDGGANTACLITEGVAGVAALAQAGQAVTAGVTITGSVVLKRGNTDWVRVLAVETNLTNGAQAWFNLATGAKGTVNPRGAGTSFTSSIESLGNGFYRCSVSCIPDGTYTVPKIYTVSASADNSTTRVNGATYIADCAQIEVGAFATSIIPTTSAAVTRAADVPAMTGTNFSSWYNQAAGTLEVEFEPTPPAGTGVVQYAACISDGTSANRIFLRRATAGGSDSAVVNASVFLGPANPATVMAAKTVSRIAMAYDNGGAATAAVNGTNGGPSSAMAVPNTMTRLDIGSGPGGASAPLNGWIRGVKYYNTRLPDAVLTALTAG